MDGVYFLTAYAQSYGGDAGNMFIKNNDAVLCQAYVYPTSGIAESCSAIVQLDIGDSVRVTGASSDPTTLTALYSGFVGHIISDNLTT